MRRALDLLLPPACAGCGRTGALLCASCLGAFRAPSRPDDRFVAPDAGVVIGEALVFALAAFAHEGPMRRALAALKYLGSSRLAPVLATAALPALRTLLCSVAADAAAPPCLVPVPVHRERRRARGYNQAELLSHCLARATRLPHEPALLVRTRATTKQHRLNRAERLANLGGVFAVRARPPLVIILVDDIITTTATLESCASVLRAAGCEAVYGFAVAREV
jgi:ComF family protein